MRISSDYFSLKKLRRVHVGLKPLPIKSLSFQLLWRSVPQSAQSTEGTGRANRAGGGGSDNVDGVDYVDGADDMDDDHLGIAISRKKRQERRLRVVRSRYIRFDDRDLELIILTYGYEDPDRPMPMSHNIRTKRFRASPYTSPMQISFVAPRVPIIPLKQLMTSTLTCD